jgi:hypothetical protein
VAGIGVQPRKDAPFEFAPKHNPPFLGPSRLVSATTFRGACHFSGIDYTTNRQTMGLVRHTTVSDGVDDKGFCS